jgi:alkaline phosphatase D
MNTLQTKYDRLAVNLLQNLKNVPIIATWDDHDYGQKMMRVGIIPKGESKELFKFF